MLLLSLTLFVSGAVVAMGSGVLDTTRQQATAANAENALSALDSGVATVAFGRSNVRTADLGRPTSGRYVVHPDAGWIELYATGGSGGRTWLMNRTALGSVTYEGGDTRVAYQDGGVWRADGPNASVMRSPPAFGDTGRTLTLPVVTVSGVTGATAGTRTATVTANGSDVRFPAPERGRTNPLSGENMTLKVHSRYAGAWARYLATETGANVTRTGDTVTANLTTLGEQGTVSLRNRVVSMHGMAAGHALTDLNVTVRAGRNGFASRGFHLSASGGGASTLRVSLERGGTNHVSCPGPGSTMPVRLTYTNGTATRTWTGDYPVTCAGGTPVLHLNLTSSRTLTYEGPGATTFDEHPADGDRTFRPGENATSAFVVRHYVALAAVDGSERIAFHRGGNDRRTGRGQTDLAASTATVNYNASGRVVTYLHATRANVSVALS